MTRRIKRHRASCAIAVRRWTLAAVIAAGAVTSTGAGAEARTDAPHRVSGASYAFDVVRSGSGVGPSVAYSAAISVVGAATPSAGEVPAVDPVVQYAVPAVAQQAGPLIEGLSEAGQSAADVGDGVGAPLAPFNPVGNALIGGTADVLDGAADASNDSIEPFDRTLVEVAQVLRLTMAPEDSMR